MLKIFICILVTILFFPITSLLVTIIPITIRYNNCTYEIQLFSHFITVVKIKEEMNTGLLLDEDIQSCSISAYSDSEGEFNRQLEELYFWMKLFLESQDEFIPKFLEKYLSQFTSDC